MAPRKYTIQYYFSVEGDTEKWYLGWLQELINSTEDATYNVKLNCNIQKNPYKYAKSLSLLSGAKKYDIYHFSDYESDDPQHVKQFLDTIQNMKKANLSGKSIKYHFGYSNLTFDLWIILHRNACNGSVTHRSHYIRYINRAFDEVFEDMDDYKKEDNFKRCLSKLNLSDVKAAIDRAKKIMETNKKNGYTLHEYMGYAYYKENPSLAIWESIEKILLDVGLIK